MSRSAIIEETKDDVSITDEDMNNEQVVDLGQVDPVSILIHSVQITLNLGLIHMVLLKYNVPEQIISCSIENWCLQFMTLSCDICQASHTESNIGQFYTVPEEISTRVLSYFLTKRFQSEVTTVLS